MRQFAVLTASILILQGCSRTTDLTVSNQSERPESWQHHLKPLETKDLSQYSQHWRAYVPVYSHIYTEDRDRVLNLAETLSVRNTDETEAIAITSVRYQSTTGKLIREYVPKPVLLESMATADFVVGQDDTSGGSGASFIVDWQAAPSVNKPLIEAIMISTGAGRNLSFVCRGIDLPPTKSAKKKLENKASAQPAPKAEGDAKGQAQKAPQDN